MTVLVTGGLGYIGSHIVRTLKAAGDVVVVVDDGSAGMRDTEGDTSLIALDLADPSSVWALADSMRAMEVSSVIHLAAKKQVTESVERPLWYYSQNLRSLETVIESMIEADVTELIFSSSAAVYGRPTGGLVGETAPLDPINPYGRTKLVGEWLCADAAEAHGLAVTSLRYFNVAGAGWPDLADRNASNLIPMVFDRIASGLPPIIFGSDYQTEDGTCIRDFVHVSDIAEAHLAALRSLRGRTSGHAVYNIGTGTGTSVRAVVDLVADVSGLAFDPEIYPRRMGDPAAVVAVVERAATDLGWSARFSVAEAIRSAWDARR